jgi:uncharacterized protein YjbI with pentapeptide repeats
MKRLFIVVLLCVLVPSAYGLTLAYENLSGQDLSGRNLEFANLSEANLTAADRPQAATL